MAAPLLRPPDAARPGAPSEPGIRAQKAHREAGAGPAEDPVPGPDQSTFERKSRVRSSRG